MMRKLLTSCTFLASFAALTACGDPGLSNPQGLQVTNYKANEAFTLSLTMSNCSRPCQDYSEMSCTVSVDSEKKEIKVDARVEVKDATTESCLETNRCDGAAVLADCKVDALEAGSYTVLASDGGFSRVITLQ